MGAKLAALPFGYIVLVAYWTVLVAELVGDKAIYTVSSLVLRIPTGTVLGAMTAAFAGKMLAAVLLGKVIARVPSHWTALLSAAAFFSSAVFIWFKEPRPMAPGPPAKDFSLRATAICFATLFFTEWGDPGQIAVAALTVQTQSLWAPWLGGLMALMTKGCLAVTVGLKLRDRLPRKKLRMLASVSCCILGILALTALASR
ncbi:MAG TPA: TMEM165/GDT1 family protein [Candidatus Acidoferrum sp.]|nr:TMEM165/GDT1 family protein [Candidatus Acidoferrum sp.]